MLQQTKHKHKRRDGCDASFVGSVFIESLGPSLLLRFSCLRRARRTPLHPRQAYGSAGVSSVVPGDISATAVGLMYSLFDTGSNLTSSDPAYGLHRAASVRLGAWEERGTTDGVMLELLGGLGLMV